MFMHKRSFSRWILGAFVLVPALGPAGCAAVLGLDEFTESAATTGSGTGTGGTGGEAPATSTSSGTGGGTASSSGAGGGGGATCVGGVTEACYEGPVGTQNIGTCKAGMHSCKGDGSEWGPCTDEVQPAIESCAFAADENCDGFDCGIWAQALGGAGEAVAFDAQGNVFVAGTFYGTLQFGGDSLISAGGTDIFLAKFDPFGKYLWSKRFGDAANQTPHAIVADSNGNAILIGDSSGTINFGGQNLPKGYFVAKLDKSGAHIWSNGAGGTYPDGFYEQKANVAIDPQDNVIVAGTFLGTMNFGNGPLPDASAATTDIFVAKLDAASGSAAPANGGWAKRFGDAKADAATGLAVDGSGSVLVAGNFDGVLNLGKTSMTAAVPAALFVAKLDFNGSQVWSNSYDGSVGNARVGVDSLGNLRVSGKFSGTLKLDGSTTLESSSGGYFVASLTTGSFVQWGSTYAVPSQFWYSAATNPSGDTILMTLGHGSADFGGGPLQGSGLSIFLAKLDAKGMHIWSKVLSTGIPQDARRIAMAPNGEAVMVGGEAGSGLSVGTLPVPDAGGYVVKLGR